MRCSAPCNYFVLFVVVCEGVVFPAVHCTLTVCCADSLVVCLLCSPSRQSSARCTRSASGNQQRRQRTISTNTRMHHALPRLRQPAANLRFGRFECGQNAAVISARNTGAGLLSEHRRKGRQSVRTICESAEDVLL